MNKELIGYHCWLTNKTNRKIVVGDLRVTLQPYAILDILDYKHSVLTVNQVENSINVGSISKIIKLNKILIRKSEPKEKATNTTIEVSKTSIQTRNRTSIKSQEKVFKELELNLDEDDIADKNADMTEDEHKPKINMRQLYNNSEYKIEED
ncbi:MAG: hypothetical protein ACOYMA_00550 [Bacteroidia bacterium]